MKSDRRRTIYSNLPRLDAVLRGSDELDHVFIENGEKGWSPRKVCSAMRDGDIVILNIDSSRLLSFCALKLILPFKKFKLISIDILLRKPTGAKSSALALVKSMLLTQVDQFLLYFKNTDGYQKHYRIPRHKISYVPFKVNAWERFEHRRLDPLAGDYVLCAGQTLRDLRTFIEAVRSCGVPAVLLTPGDSVMKSHGTELITERLPENLKVATHDDGREETFLRWIAGAAAVVIPRFRDDIASTGISTYLCAMAASRCVILSKGPGAEELLTGGEAVLVEPEDAAALSRAILKVWHDRAFREATATKGRQYAELLRGEERLLRDIVRSAQQIDDSPMGAPNRSRDV